MDKDLEEKVDRFQWLAWTTVAISFFLLVMGVVYIIIPNITKLVLIVPGTLAFALSIAYIICVWPIECEHERRRQAYFAERRYNHRRAMANLAELEASNEIYMKYIKRRH